MKRIKTVWEVWSYDVWGNKRDGYEVNDRYCEHREYEIDIMPTVNNKGTSQEFVSAYPSNYAIKQALSIKKHVSIETDGDDVSIYVETSDGYPLGVLYCESHESLSPIKEVPKY